MLLARGHKPVGSADLCWALLFGSGVWSVVADRSGLFLDTRFFPAASGPARPRSCLYLLTRGSWTVHGAAQAPFIAPCAFVVPEAQIEGADGRRALTFSERGEPFQAVEIHVPDVALAIPPSSSPMRITVDDRLLGTASEMAQLARHDDSSLANLYAELLGDMARLGILDAKAVAAILRPTARPIVRLWAGLRPLIERLYLNPTLQEVGHKSGLSSRQLDRLINAFVGSFDIKGTRWRETTLRVRVELAVLLLSADGVSVADIARVAGYGSSEAMARTFRDAGLPAPAVVQQAVRAARSET